AGARLVLLASGYEFRRVDAVKALGLPMVVRVDFPRKPDVSTPEKAEAGPLRDLRDFVLPPRNPRILDRAGVHIAVSARGPDKRDDFPAGMRAAIEAGWPADRALAALTTTPADIIGASTTRGTLDPGKAADFIVTDGDLFAEKTLVRETWIGGNE